MNDLLFTGTLFVIAFTYALVGHGGASGYLALMGIAGIAPDVMKPGALVLNLCVSLIAFAQFSRAGHFRLKLFWPFAIASVPCAFIGGGIHLDPLLYKRILGACIVIASLRLSGAFSPDGRPLRSAPIPLALLIGATIGLLSGLLGIGGGVLLSPVLLLCAWADAKSAAAVSAAFIFVNSAAGLLGMKSGAIAVAEELVVWTSVAIVGGLLGSWIGARRTPEPRLKQVLGAVLLFAGVKLFWS